VKPRRRSVLHVDLDPFFVAVERSLDVSLRGRPVVIGGDGGGLGFVATASDEARQAGVRVGLPLPEARRLCPGAAFLRGDLDTYGRVSEEVTAVLLAASRRLERPSADEAFVDLTPDSPGDPAPVHTAERIRDELQRRLGLDASLGLASSRLAARIASGWARPRGLLVVLPGYELSFLAGKSVAELDLPPHLQAALERAGMSTLGQVADADEKALAAAIGAAADRLRAAARGEDERPLAVAAPPAFLQEEATIRDRRSDGRAIEDVLDAVARRAARRLKPFRLAAAALSVEIRRANETTRRAEALRPAVADEDALASRACSLAAAVLEPAEGVRAVVVRLSRLEPPFAQATLFPASPALRHAR
jgi:DNA polymerase-4